jgi:CRP-like cAMP-binding protein
MNRAAQDRACDPEWDNLFRPQAAPEEPLEEVLARVPIFSLLSNRELRQIARTVHRRHFRPGETIIWRGVEQSGFYLIRSGAVHIVREDRGHAPVVVDALGPGELLGEFALLDSTPRTSSAVAAQPSEMIGFFRPDLMDILVTRPTLGCKILLRLAEEMNLRLARDYRALRQTGYAPPDLAGAERAVLL